MDEFQIFVVGITSIAIIVLIYFGIKNLVTGQGDKLKAMLMVAAGILTALNLILWFTFPEMN